MGLLILLSAHVANPVCFSPYLLSPHPPVSLTECPGFGVFSFTTGDPEGLPYGASISILAYTCLCVAFSCPVLCVFSSTCRSAEHCVCVCVWGHCFQFKPSSLLCPWITAGSFWDRKLLRGPLCRPLPQRAQGRPYRASRLVHGGKQGTQTPSSSACADPTFQAHLHLPAPARQSFCILMTNQVR